MVFGIILKQDGTDNNRPSTELFGCVTSDQPGLIVTVYH